MKKIIRLETEFKNLILKADEIYIAVAMLTDYGLDIFDNRNEDCHFELLVGYDLPTKPSALQKLLDSGVETKIYDVKKQFFHPKLYLFKIDEKWIAFMGSGNCTKGGLKTNIELSLKLEDAKTVRELLDWYKTYFKLGTTLKQEWLEEYKLFFKERNDKENQIKAITKNFKKQTGVYKGEISLEEYNFENQFFKYEHFNAFTPPKPIEDKPGPIEERLKVRNKLEELHKLIYPIISKNSWDVFPHHLTQHLTSSFRHNQYASNSLDAIWLHYGRSEDELEHYKKAFGDNMTSLYHMRLEVLIGRGNLFTELRVGKRDGSYPDRYYIKEQLKKSTQFVKQYYKLITELDDDFRIVINDEAEVVRNFQDANDLKEFTLQDKPKCYYFSIGKMYKPDDKRISQNNIVNTIINDFKQIYPVYQLFKHKIPS